MNYGAVFLGGEIYKRISRILKPGPKVLPSPAAIGVHLHDREHFSVLSLRMAMRAFDIIKMFKFFKNEFMSDYSKLMDDCENMQFKDALPKHPLLNELFYITAEQLIEKMGWQKLAEILLTPFVHACTGTPVSLLSGFDYCMCAQGLTVTDGTYFSFDDEVMIKRLGQGKGNVLIESVTALSKNADGTYGVETDSGKSFSAKNVIMTTPANVTQNLVKPIAEIRKIRNASSLHVFLVRGQMKEAYRKYIINEFSEDIPIIFTRKRAQNEWSVFSKTELDFGKYFDKYDIITTKYWPCALFTNPNIVLPQNLAENFYMGGDHNGLGMEPAAVSGIYAAKQIIKTKRRRNK